MGGERPVWVAGLFLFSWNDFFLIFELFFNWSMAKSRTRLSDSTDSCCWLYVSQGYNVMWCWRKLLKRPLNSKEIKPVNLKGNQPWIFLGRTDAETEATILWPPDVKSRLLRKDPGAGKDWRWEEKGMTEDEMVGWHHWLNGHEFEQVLGDGEGQGSLACCSPWCLKESDTTEQLNNNK